MFSLFSWRAGLVLFFGGRPRVFPVRLRSFAVAILGDPFVVLGDVVESGFSGVHDNACRSVLVENVEDEASFSVCLFLFHCVAIFVVDSLVMIKCLNRVGEEAFDP